jgi:hypothetical protein
MAGLNNLLSDTQQTTTTLPSWYDAAQQQVVGQGVSAFNQAPQMGQTVAQGAINQLQPGAANPFTQAQSSLQQISSGAANPWITDSSGQVSPNTNTAMGGLFAAQNQQLQQMMPNYTAPTQGANIASGNFGSLRGQTAYNKAMGDAMAELNTKQMQAALQNQQTGVQGAQQLGNVTNQGISAAMNVGKEQQNAPFTNVGNLASLLGTIQAPATVSSQKQLSPLGQMTTLGNAAMGGLNSLTALSKTPVGESILKAVGLDKAFGVKPTNTPQFAPGTYQIAGGGTMQVGSNGYTMTTYPDGKVVVTDSKGNTLNETTSKKLQEQWEAQDKENGSGDTSGGDTGGGDTGGGDTGGGGNLPDSTDTTDNGDYNGVDYSGYVPPEADLPSYEPIPDYSADYGGFYD